MGPLFQFFSGIVRIFFENFLMSQKSPPFEFFDILQPKGCWKSPKPPFYIFRHYETVQNDHFSFFFSTTF